MKFKINIKYTVALLIIQLLFSYQQVISKKDDLNDFDDLINLLEQKVETVSKYSQSVTEAPSSVSVITAEEIKRFGYYTLSDALNSLRGFLLRSDRVYTYFGIRGLDNPNSYNNNIVLMVNGHKINDYVYFTPGFGYELPFNLDIVDRIEVVRGPGSSIYGTAALTGVINVITKSGKMYDGVESGVSYGNLNYTRAKISYGKNLGSDFDFIIAANYTKDDGENIYFQEFDDTTTNNGIADNLDGFKSYSLFSEIAYKSLKFNLFFSDYFKSIPTAAWGMTFNDILAESRDRRLLLDLKYDIEINPYLLLTTNFSYDNYLYSGTYPAETLSYDRNISNCYSFNLDLNYDISETNRLVVGTELKYVDKSDYDYWYSDGNNIFYKNLPFNQYSAYFQDNWQLLDNLMIVAGLRYDEFTNLGNSFSPKASVIFSPLKTTTIKAIYNRSFRVPNLYELYFIDYPYQKSNPNLKPEFVNSMELNFEHYFSRSFSFSISGFYNKFEDMIVLEQMEDGINQFQNSKDVSLIGFDFELKFNFLHDLISYISYSFQNIEDNLSRETFPNHSEHLLKAGLSYQIYDFTISAESYSESGRFDFNNHKGPSFTIMNGFVSYHPIVNAESTFSVLNNLNLNFKVYNLFDVSYGLPGGYDFVQNTIPQPIRRFFIELVYQDR